MTPTSSKSDWVSKEIHIALDEKRHIFPLLLGGRRFGILSNVQFQDVSDGNLPPPKFFDDLGKTFPPSKLPEETLHENPNLQLGDFFTTNEPRGGLIRPDGVFSDFYELGELAKFAASARLSREVAIVERLRKLLESPRLQFESSDVESLLALSNEIFCKVGRAYVYENDQFLYASIRESYLRNVIVDAMTELPDSWRKFRFSKGHNRAIFSVNQFPHESFSPLFDSDLFYYREWERTNYAQNLVVVARELIDVNLMLGSNIKDIDVVGSGF
jgi:hypothetical protein